MHFTIDTVNGGVDMSDATISHIALYSLSLGKRASASALMAQKRHLTARAVVNDAI